MNPNARPLDRAASQIFYKAPETERRAASIEGFAYPQNMPLSRAVTANAGFQIKSPWLVTVNFGERKALRL
ncbi:hypothetical protein DKP76_15405 [Falsochrobactrum shanghaiense]|uniref:Uncharacterized protein n=1 Tax=Falsochrobactrum shanghaiense TaxID=2201899 RepID=A0A316J4N6_9HYPH|nr:hypothetical protein DKP76_15405 [Falsochrobactrum shanghaiense]